MMATRSELDSVRESALYVAFELGSREWKLGMTTSLGVRPWIRTVPAGDLEAVRRTLDGARRRWGLGADAPVHSCYEAGRDGFWIHRAVVALGVQNRVVDSSSIEVSRRARRSKTDRLDATKLVLMLVRVCAGDTRAWREVRVPTAAVEAARQASREREALTKEQTRLRNQITSLLATVGSRVSRRQRRLPAWWTVARTWEGAALAEEIQGRLARTEQRLALVQAQLQELAATQQAALTVQPATAPLPALVRLKGIARTGASTLLAEGLVWRAFRNRREVGGLLGFAPAPYQSGTEARDQGIRRAGNAHLQAVSIQLAWSWIRWQPDSALTRWYHAHFGERRRARKIGIVAVARKLLIALWRYVTQGVIPEGAVLKPAA